VKAQGRLGLNKPKEEGGGEKMKKKAGLKTVTNLPEKMLNKAASYDFVVPYAGRWVIIVNNKVVADGSTAGDAISRIPSKTKLEQSLLFKVPAEPDRLLVV